MDRRCFSLLAKKKIFILKKPATLFFFLPHLRVFLAPDYPVFLAQARKRAFSSS
jgi:hypothetical protein